MFHSVAILFKINITNNRKLTKLVCSNSKARFDERLHILNDAVLSYCHIQYADADKGN